MPGPKFRNPNDEASMDSGDGAQPDDLPPSKTQRKKQSHALQALGEQLVALSDAKLTQVPMPESLRDAVLMAQRTRSREGKRRQMQFIGRLMREVDADAIAQALAIDSEQHRGAVTAMHSAERWRDGLIDGSLNLTDFVARYPAGASAPLASLLTSARQEREAQKPPAHLRALYRELHRIIADHDLDPARTRHAGQ
jgi:ribosome-associated protein